MNGKTLNRIKRFLPFGILVGMVLTAYMLGAFDLLSFDKIRVIEKSLLELVLTRPVIAMLLFACLYMCVAISTVPGLLALDLMAGYFFGQVLSIVCVLSGALAGALALFLATRYAFGDRLLKGRGQLVTKIKEGFDRNQTGYLLFLRVVPFIPFGLASIVLGVMNVRIRKFIWTTMAGMFPVSFTLTQAGTGLGQILHSDGAITVNSFMNPQLIFALVSIGLLTLIPILIPKKKPKVE